MHYNTDINSFGGIQDYHMIHESLRSFLNEETDLKKRMVEDNIFGIRTEEGRGRFYRGIKSSILDFKNENHKDLYFSFFSKLDNELPYNFLIFWQLVINNKLFRILTSELYLKYYFNGKTSITGNEVFYFLMDLKERDPEFKELNWTKKTMEPLASKYLTILRKLGFLEGVQKKQLLYVQITDDVLTVFLYLLSTLNTSGENYLKSDYQIFSFVPVESFPDRVKKIAKKGLIGMSYTGTKLTIEPILKYKELVDGIFR